MLPATTAKPLREDEVRGACQYDSNFGNAVLILADVIVDEVGIGAHQGCRRLDGGEIRFEGKPLPKKETDIRQVRQRMGMVFQGFELFPHKTALENVAIGLTTVKKMAAKAARTRARTLLAKVGPADRTTNYPANHSSDQQQRVAIARALAMKPHVTLFDEPTSALDPETVGEVQNVMRNLAQEGMTMIVVTHEMSFARRVANWVVVFERGQLLEQGPPQQIFEAPTIERTRDFLSHLGWSGWPRPTKWRGRTGTDRVEPAWRAFPV
jgi:polar amino acid transport system ATP-binding protein